MPAINLPRAVQNVAERLHVDLQRPLAPADAERIQSELSAVGVDTSVAEIAAAREALVRNAASRTADAGDRTRADRDASAGAALGFGGSGALNSVLAARTGAPAFDADKALIAAYGDEMRAAGTLQWRGAETGLSMTRMRWIPSEAELAAMEQRPLSSVLPNAKHAEHITLHLPRGAKAGDTAYLRLDQPGFPEAQWASLSLRAPAVATPAPSPTTGPSAVDAARELLASLGVPAADVNVLKSTTNKADDTALLFMTADKLSEHADKLISSFEGAGMKEVFRDEYGVRSRLFEDDAGRLFGVRRDEVGGVA